MKKKRKYILKKKIEPIESVETVSKIKVDPVVTVNEKEDIEPVKLAESPIGPCAECGHGKLVHYGGSSGWCNTNQCSCRMFV
jgi:hypothetical protein